MGASLRPALVQLTVNTSPPSDFRMPLASFAAIRNSACPPAARFAFSRDRATLVHSYLLQPALLHMKSSNKEIHVVSAGNSGGSPATVLSVSGAPRTSHSGACASAVDAVTLTGEPRMCTPSMVADITYWPVVRAQYVYECTAAFTAPAVTGVGAGPCTCTCAQHERFC